jgi:23S rRNA pseudouridine955/2504/2580 synthase
VRHVQIDAQEQGQRLDKVLARLLPGVPRSRIFRLIRRGEVRVNGRRASPELRLAAGDSVRLPPVREVAPDAPRRVPAGMIEVIERAIIHEDERLLVLDKPGGMAVHGGSGLSFGVIEALRASRPTDPGAGASAGSRHQRLAAGGEAQLGAARAACAAA